MEVLTAGPGRRATGGSQRVEAYHSYENYHLAKLKNASFLPHCW